MRCMAAFSWCIRRAHDLRGGQNLVTVHTLWVLQQQYPAYFKSPSAVLSASDACLGRTGTECRRAGYDGKCYFIGRTPCSRVHDAV